MPAKMRRKVARIRESNNRPNLLRARFSCEDRAEQLMGRREVRSRGHNRRPSFSFFYQPCVHSEVFLEIGQTPIREKLIGARAEKEIVWNVDRGTRCASLDFFGRRDLFLANVSIRSVEREQKNVARGRNTLCVKEQLRLSAESEDTLIGR